MPPGFGTAFRIAKGWIDPGLDGDPFADKPYLYSPLIATITRLRVGGKVNKKKRKVDQGELEKDEEEEGYEIEERGEEVIEEGALGNESEMLRKEKGMPNGANERRNWGLEHKGEWVWEAGRSYSMDFFNPYLDFNNFALKLPGFSLPVLGRIGGKDDLR